MCYNIINNDFPIQKVALIKGVDYYNIGKIDNIDIENKELKHRYFKSYKTFKDFND